MNTQAGELRRGRAPYGASPRMIESTLSANREAIDHTLTEIQERLTAEGLMNIAMERLRSDSGTEFLRGLRDTVVHNPMPVTVIALAMLWAAMSERAGPPTRVAGEAQEFAGRVKGQAHEARGAVRGRAHEARGAASGRLRGARGRTREMMDRGRAGIARAGGSAATRSRRSASRGWELTREHPVLMAGAGIAFGAAVAALLPTTRMERERVGPVRDEAVRGGARFATEAGRGAVSGATEGESESRTAREPDTGDRGPAERSL